MGEQKSDVRSQMSDLSGGSCNEVEVLIDMMFDLSYIDKSTHEDFIIQYVELRKQIYTTIEKWN